MRSNPRVRPGELQALEFDEYIRAFKSSSDRSRYVIFINIAISLLILICTWNVSDFSWSWRRIDAAEAPLRAQFESEYARRHPAPPGTVLNNPPPNNSSGRSWDAAKNDFVEQQLRLDRAKRYREDAIEELFLVSIPGLGGHVDVNDLGLLGGLTLLVLLVLLVFSSVREHENLYLALFKIKRLCECEPRSHYDGESLPNFLYHSLAMGQVLSYPPTLARWGYSWRNKCAGAARWLVVFVPGLVHLYVVASNVATFAVATEAWGTIAVARVSLQVLLLLGILSLALLSCLYIRACNLRWRAAFEMINPGLHRMQTRSWREWLRLKPSSTLNGRQRAILSELVYSFHLDRPLSEIPSFTVVGKVHGLPHDAQGQVWFPRAKQVAMALDVATKADAEASRRGVKVRRYEATRHMIENDTWKAEVTCFLDP